MISQVLQYVATQRHFQSFSDAVRVSKGELNVSHLFSFFKRGGVDEIRKGP